MPDKPVVPLPPEPGAMSLGRLDTERLHALIPLLGGPEDFRELAAGFIEDTAACMARLAQDLEDLDRSRIERRAHDLKSNAGNFGLLELMRLAADLEAEAEGADRERLADLLDAARQAYSAGRSSLEAFMGSL